MVEFFFCLLAFSERVCRTNRSQPRNWHRRLWNVRLPSAVCRPGRNSFHRKVPEPGCNWQHAQLVRKLHLRRSKRHLRKGFHPGAARFRTHTTSKSLLLFYILSNNVIHSSAKGHALPTVEYTSVGVQVTSGSSTGSSINVHPNGDNSKCVGILGGTYANGNAVDMYVTLRN